MIRVALAAIHEGGRFFLQRRAPGSKVFPGLWEFPGGKIEEGETPREALLRELREELDWTPDSAEPLAAVVHAYPGLEVELNLFLCEGVSRPRTALAWGWFEPIEAAELPVPGGSRRLIALLQNREKCR